MEEGGRVKGRSPIERPGTEFTGARQTAFEAHRKPRGNCDDGGKAMYVNKDVSHSSF